DERRRRRLDPLCDLAHVTEPRKAGCTAEKRKPYTVRVVAFANAAATSPGSMPTSSASIPTGSTRNDFGGTPTAPAASVAGPPRPRARRVHRARHRDREPAEHERRVKQDPKALFLERLQQSADDVAHARPDGARDRADEARGLPRARCRLAAEHDAFHGGAGA